MEFYKAPSPTQQISTSSSSFSCRSISTPSSDPIFLLLFDFLMKLTPNRSLTQGDTSDFLSLKGPRVYELEDLLRASTEVLGKGTAVAVKRLKEVGISERKMGSKSCDYGGSLN